MCPHHLLLIQSGSEAAPQTAKKTVRQRGPLRCRTASLGPALRGPTSPKAKRKTCFIRHDLGLRRCLESQYKAPSTFREASMNQVKTQSCRVGVAALVVIGALSISACSAPVTEQPPPATGVTVFEGARLIAGDGGAPIENAAFIVEDTHFVQVGKSGELKVPAGAARVDLTGKTVMPAI